MASEILVLWPGIEPRPSVVKAPSPSHWTAREFPSMLSCSVIDQLLGPPLDCSLPGSSVYGILQARILEWVAISFSRGSSRLRNQTRVSCIADRLFTNCTTREAP